MKKGICFQNLSTLATISTMASCGIYMTLLHHIIIYYISIYLDLLPDLLLDLLLVNVWTPATRATSARPPGLQLSQPSRRFQGCGEILQNQRWGNLPLSAKFSLEIFEIFTPQVFLCVKTAKVNLTQRFFCVHEQPCYNRFWCWAGHKSQGMDLTRSSEYEEYIATDIYRLWMTDWKRIRKLQKTAWKPTWHTWAPDSCQAT